MMPELLQQVRILDPLAEVDQVGDVLISDGCIRAIAPHLADRPQDGTIVDGRGLVLGTGLVDLYSHSGEPGFEDRETLDSLRQAAIAGGFTRLAILPDTTPPLDNPGSLSWILEHWQRLSAPLPRLLPWAALTVAGEGQQMGELAELATCAIAGFADGKPLSNLNLVWRLLEYGQPLNQPIALSACDPTLTSDGVMREGQESIRFGLPGIPAIAETAALAAILECVAATGTPVHLMRISTARSVELIQVAKQRGLPVTASTTWLHLLLDSPALKDYDPNLRLHPPLGNPSDRQQLIQAIREGILDAIAIDHTPYTYEEKTVAFGEAPAGAIGLELALPLLWQGLVEPGELSALQLWRSLSTQAAQCLRQTPAAIAPGHPAELILFDPQSSWEVTPDNLKSRSSNTSWLGQAIAGKISRIWC